MVYFRRPQTPFVNAELSQKPQSQWKLVAQGQETNSTIAATFSNDTCEGQSSSNSSLRQAADNVVAEAEESKITTENTSTDAADPASTITTTTTDAQEEDNTDEELAQSLEKRLQLELKHHPESVLLCGYFHEELMDDHCLSLSTYLPGVQPRELRVYYGEGVLKIAGARALYNLVQRFERSFALDERLLETCNIKAILHNGMLVIRVPLVAMPPPPLQITVVEANPIILFQHQNAKHRKDIFYMEIDVPGVQLKDLTVEYSNGSLRLLWERMEPTLGDGANSNHDSAGNPKNNMRNNNNSNNNPRNMNNSEERNKSPTNNTTQSQWQSSSPPTMKLRQMRFERIIPINTLQIDTTKIIAYLDHHSKAHGVLTLVAPRKLKRTTRPIQVYTAKDLQEETEQGIDNNTNTTTTTTTNNNNNNNNHSSNDDDGIVTTKSAEWNDPATQEEEDDNDGFTNSGQFQGKTPY